MDPAFEDSGHPEEPNDCYVEPPPPPPLPADLIPSAIAKPIVPATATGAVVKGSRASPLSPGGMDQESKAFVDEFGFELRDASQVAEEQKYVRSLDGEKVLRHEIKWARMTADWAASMEKNFEKMKERSRKGIPSKLRGVVWQLLTASRHNMEAESNRGVYAMLLQKPLDAEVEGLIERDLGRTFPTHSLFRSEDSVGQTQLRNILHAYGVVDPEVGYVQGMGFIVGTLLTQMGEEETFWMLHSMMHNETYRLRELFRPGFPMLQLFFYQLKRLIQTQIPKLHQHMEEQHCDMSFFSSQWFLTLFVYHFQFRAVLRIWDIFLTEGWKIIFRVAICLLKWEEKELLGLSFDYLMPRIKTLHEGKPCDEIVNRALKVKFKTEQLLAFRKEFEQGSR